MTVLARDAVASDHLVYAWPFPIGPDCEVACAEDEQVVMCPAWLVGDRLGPGRHAWRTPDPSRPVHAFFVLMAPVEVSFDMTTSFLIPTTGQPVRLRAVGSLQVRCTDPGLLIAQFVGLPFDSVNDGVLRSVSRSVERMLARLATRRVVMAGTPHAVTDPSMLNGITEELVAYNPTAGAVFGIELIRVGHLTIAADNGDGPYVSIAQVAAPAPMDWGGGSQPAIAPLISQPAASAPLSWDGNSQSSITPLPPPPVPEPTHGNPVMSVSGEIGGPKSNGKPSRAHDPMLETVRGHHRGPLAHEVSTIPPPVGVAPASPAQFPRPGSVPNIPGGESTDEGPGNQLKATSGEINARPRRPSDAVPRATARPVEMPASSEDSTQPGVATPLPPLPRIPMPAAAGTPAPSLGAAPPPPPPPISAAALKPLPRPAAPALGTKPPDDAAKPGNEEKRGAIMGIGMQHLGGGVAVSGEIPTKVPPGSRVLVPGPNGLMQSATVRQLLQGYYELEVGSSGETIWVPIAGVVPEPH
ncbi:MAG TPA: hypothetical protein VGM88_19220 [Kofleriaceae bacterium]|jgi:hypothetical protein